MKQRSGAGPKPLGDVLARLSDILLPRDPQLRRELVADAFSRVAGREVGRHCRLLELSGGILTVAVPAARWRQELAPLSNRILIRLNSELPQQLRLTEIRFVPAAEPGEP